MYSRRNFIKFTSLAAVGGLMFSGNINIFGQVKGYFPIPAEVYSENNYLFRQENFEPLVNSDFNVFRENLSSVSMRLVEVIGKDEKKIRLERVPTEKFSLIFEVHGRGILKDEIYNISHPVIGEFQMFISTIGRSGKRYQAVFSRIYF